MTDDGEKDPRDEWREGYGERLDEAAAVLIEGHEKQQPRQPKPDAGDDGGGQS